MEIRKAGREWGEGRGFEFWVLGCGTGRDNVSFCSAPRRGAISRVMRVRRPVFPKRAFPRAAGLPCEAASAKHGPPPPKKTVEKVLSFELKALAQPPGSAVVPAARRNSKYPISNKEYPRNKGAKQKTEDRIQNPESRRAGTMPQRAPIPYLLSPISYSEY